MNIRHKNWNEEYKTRPVQKPQYDLWLDKHNHILGTSFDAPIVDLGCGFGNDSLYLSEHGYQVISCDISNEALERVKLFVPNSKTVIVDMLKGLPFDSSSIKVLIADLSLHYFPWKDTLNIVNEISRVLAPGGYLLCRLNSTNDVNYGAGQGVMLEENYYAVKGNTKRFFNRQQIESLFHVWDIQYINECKMGRYKIPKILWEAALKSQKVQG